MSNKILIKSNRDPLFGHTREELIQQFRTTLNGRVKAGYFFGSFAQDRVNTESDIDLILIVETEVPFLERSREFSDLLDIVPTVDILVYTSVEFAALTENPSAGFWQSVVRSLHRFM